MHILPNLLRKRRYKSLFGPYGYRCAVCGSGLRTHGGKPGVQSAHIYPKRLDGTPRYPSPLCGRGYTDLPQIYPGLLHSAWGRAHSRGSKRTSRVPSPLNRALKRSSGSLVIRDAYLLFGFLAYIRYDPEPDAAVAQLLEHGRDLRVNVQSLESVRLPRREAD